MNHVYLKFIQYNKKYVVGALCKRHGKYYFKLVSGYEELSKKFAVLKNVLPFKNEKCIYESKELFSIFKSRVPDIKQYNENELKELLEMYNLEKYDEFEFLKITKGQLVKDNFLVEV